MNPRWDIAHRISAEVQSQFSDLHPVLLQLLWNRGLSTREQMDRYLAPEWERDTHAPSEFSNMRAAVDRVFAALQRSEAVAIHGDYDADGVCGSAVLMTTLRDICRALGYRGSTSSYIPHREKEGYGLSVETVEHLHNHERAKLIITVDCGISNNEAIDRGQELGIDTIVCDHHTMPAQLPTSAVLIHPLVPGETYPNKHLCGTGVAFKLASALIDEARRRGATLPIGHEKWLLDLVAIATVTDVMPLHGENRVLERFGLVVLNKTRRKGIQKLLDVAGSKIGALDTVSIGFQIGPRLNAAGRMAHASSALELLIEEDDLRATTLAMQLHETNMERQKASQAMYVAARAQVASDPSKVLVAVDEGWPAGLVGLVAGKLLAEFHRPVLVVGRDGEKFVGSGRSIDGFDITAALRSASEHLDRFGGHPQACGFSTSGKDRFASAIDAIRAFADRALSEELLEPALRIDAELDLESVDWALFDGLVQMRPFGTGNPEPVFVSRGVRVVGIDAVGNGGKHLRLRVQSPHGKIFSAIGFGLGHHAAHLSLGQSVDIVYTVDVNEWNGNRELQLKVEEVDRTL